jgi:ankyrin repeat protein
VTDGEGRTALLLASVHGSIRTVRRLLSHKASPDIADDQGQTPLMHAIMNHHDDVAQCLMDSGANVHARDEQGWPALLHATFQKCSPTLINCLVDKGADVNAGSPSGYTPLMQAAEYGNESVLTSILANGADVHIKSSNGRSALAWAALGSNVPTMRLLLAAHVDAQEAIAVLSGQAQSLAAASHLRDISRESNNRPRTADGAAGLDHACDVCERSQCSCQSSHSASGIPLASVSSSAKKVRISNSSQYPSHHNSSPAQNDAASVQAHPGPAMNQSPSSHGTTKRGWPSWY